MDEAINLRKQHSVTVPLNVHLRRSFPSFRPRLPQHGDSIPPTILSGGGGGDGGEGEERGGEEGGGGEG